MRRTLIVGSLLVLTGATLACGREGGTPEHEAQRETVRVNSPPAASALPADSSDAGMTGALGIRFGATRESIVAERGAPQFDQVGFEGVHSLGYPVSVMGQEAVAMFLVDARAGMVRVLIGAPVPDVGRCAFVLALWQRGLEQKYGAGRTDGTSPSVGCERFAARGTMWGEAWREPATGRRILLSLMPGQAAVTLLYTTPEADAWERRKNAGEL